MLRSHTRGQFLKRDRHRPHRQCLTTVLGMAPLDAAVLTQKLLRIAARLSTILRLRFVSKSREIIRRGCPCPVLTHS